MSEKNISHRSCTHKIIIYTVKIRNKLPEQFNSLKKGVGTPEILIGGQ